MPDTHAEFLCSGNLHGVELRTAPGREHGLPGSYRAYRPNLVIYFRTLPEPCASAVACPKRPAENPSTMHRVDTILNVEVRKSPIEDSGVFASRCFSPGDLIRVVNVVREIADEFPLRPESGEKAEHCAYPDGKVLLFGLPDRHINHSCDPNAYEGYEDGVYRILARRVIKPNEEITVDYLINNSGGDSWRCNCGATRCRGDTGTSFFELPAEIQQEYEPLLATWFRKRHADRLEYFGHT